MPKRIKPEKPLRELLASHRSEPEEEVRTFTAKLQEFVEGRELAVFSALAAVVVVAGALGIIWFLKSNEESLAADRLGVAYAGYRGSVFGDPLNPETQPPLWDPRSVAEDAGALAEVAGAHEASRAGRLAHYLAGNAYLRAGAPGKAIPLLEKAVAVLGGEEGALGYALGALGAAYEDEGAAEKSLAAYTRLSTLTDPRFKAEGLLGRARTLRALGRNEEAQAALTRAQAEFPEMAQGAPPGVQVRVREGGQAASDQ